MASVVAKDIPIEAQFMTDFWNFRKKYYIPEDDDQYWSEFCSEAEELIEKYPTEYYKKIILLCLADRENLFRKKGKSYEQNA